MRPIEEPTVEQEENAKTLYYNVNPATNNDDVQTSHLRGNKSSGINADISQEDVPI
jgi:hypothetical protein